jgi:hypothetical protein
MSTATNVTAPARIRNDSIRVVAALTEVDVLQSSRGSCAVQAQPDIYFEASCAMLPFDHTSWRCRHEAIPGLLRGARAIVPDLPARQ